MAPSQHYLAKLKDLCHEPEIAKCTVDGRYLVLAWSFLVEQYLLKNTASNAIYSVAFFALRELTRYQTTDAVYTQLHDLHIRKNAGYAGDDPDPWKNFRAVEVFGISAADGCLTRLSDKYARWCVLKDNPEKDLVNESIADTLMDMVAYCLILICLLEEGHATV